MSRLLQRTTHFRLVEGNLLVYCIQVEGVGTRLWSVEEMMMMGWMMEERIGEVGGGIVE